tara:strand:+ start:205 stop:378 length:174 start_codon:yes stop_codon:yes gene_type:complete
MNNLLDHLSLGKVLNKYKVIPLTEQGDVLISIRKTSAWSSIQRLTRKIEFKHSVVDA